MVARDGIEPPTPAFSGPRSTTELPGLGNRTRRLIGAAKNARAYVCRISFSRDLPSAGSSNANASQVYQAQPRSPSSAASIMKSRSDHYLLFPEHAILGSITLKGCLHATIARAALCSFPHLVVDSRRATSRKGSCKA